MTIEEMLTGYLFQGYASGGLTRRLTRNANLYVGNRYVNEFKRTCRCVWDARSYADLPQSTDARNVLVVLPTGVVLYKPYQNISPKLWNKIEHWVSENTENIDKTFRMANRVFYVRRVSDDAYRIVGTGSQGRAGTFHQHIMSNLPTEA